MNRITRQQRMDAHLEVGLKATGDERTQRQMLEAIIRDAHFAGIPVLEYLSAKLALKVTQPLPTTAPFSAIPVRTDFKCGNCGKTFTTKHALCGHQKKHSGQNHLQPSL